jgi:uncharacterized protein YueI
MFTLKEKIVLVLSEIKTLESSLQFSESRDLPNVYHNNLLLQIAIKEDSLQSYLNQISVTPATIKVPAVYSLE